MAYAEGTTVPIEKSMNEIVSLLKKRGALRIAQVEEVEFIAVQFFMNDRMLRFKVALLTPAQVNGKRGIRPASESERKASAMQRNKARVRALLLVIKAKLESVDSEVESFEEAFLANVVMADGKTLYERVQEPIALEYSDGKQRPMLLGYAGSA
jgi:hypothetical protein